MPAPARITIELEPPARPRERWVARTRIEELEAPAEVERPAVVEAPAVVERPIALEQREPSVVPVGYEPPEDCTCLDGFCNADHANE